MVAAVAHHGVWELVFLMVILKIPILYLCGVVYYAIKAKPLPGEGAPVAVRPPGDPPDTGRRFRPQRFRPRPHGPSRSYPRTPRVAQARAEGDRR